MLEVDYFLEEHHQQNYISMKSKFFNILYKVQGSSEAIGVDVDVAERYGMLRLSRRGAIAYTRNMHMNKKVIEVVHR